MPINNLELIKPLLNFHNAGDFYTVYIMLRKKDMVTDKANHQSVRVIKAYYIYDLATLENRWEEIVKLSELFKARVYIAVNRVNDGEVGLSMINKIVDHMRNGTKGYKNIFDKVVGELPSLDKRWVIDIDDLSDCVIIEEFIKVCRPEGNKIIARIPTKSGLHFITQRFDVMRFQQLCDENNIVMPDVQKTNPTVLYIPDSLLVM